MAEPGRGDEGHGVSGIFHFDYGDVFIFQALHGLGDQQGRSPFLRGLGNLAGGAERPDKRKIK